MANEPGRKPSKSLFKGMADTDDEAIYDLDEFHERFLEEQDITEYRPAIKLVGSWKEWNRIKRDWPAFSSLIEDWKIELEIKFRSDACQRILELQRDSSSESVQLQAARFLSSAEWDKRQVGSGRPNKKQQERAAREVAELAAETRQESERILRMVQGGKT